MVPKGGEGVPEGQRETSPVALAPGVTVHYNAVPWRGMRVKLRCNILIAILFEVVNSLL